MLRRSILLISGLLLSVFVANAIEVKTEAQSVTVFTNGAQVTRTKSVSLPAGQSEIKFIGLSRCIDAKSIQVKATGGVTVLAVSLQKNYIGEKIRSTAIETLTKQNDDIKDRIKAEKAEVEVIESEISFIKENSQLSGKDQAVSFLNLKQINDYYRQRLTSLKQSKLSYEKSIEELKKQSGALEKQINELNGKKDDTTTGEIVVKVNSTSASTSLFTITYVVSNAGWLPSYDVRAKDVQSPMQIVYKANVRQNTGEEWNNVTLKLSTANPQQGGVVPELTPYVVGRKHTITTSDFSNQVSGRVTLKDNSTPAIGAMVSVVGNTIGTFTDAEGRYSLTVPKKGSTLEFRYIGYETVRRNASIETINVRLHEADANRNEYRAMSMAKVQKEAPMLARSAGASVMMDEATEEDFGSNAPEVKTTQTATNTEFEIRVPYTVKSDNKAVVVDIENYSVPAQYEYRAVPKLSSNVYLTARITDWQKLNLVSGEANLFFENTFVGKSIIDAQQTSDTLQMSLGVDRGVVVKREMQKDFTTRKMIGSKQSVAKGWRITVKNNKPHAIRIKIEDQLPLSDNNDISVEANEVSGGSRNSETGIVSWIFDPMSAGSSKSFDLRYTIKFPKTMNPVIE